MTTYSERLHVYLEPRDLNTVMRAWGRDNGYAGARGGWIYNEGTGRTVTQGYWNLWAMKREQVLDWLTTKHTALSSFEDLLSAGSPTYRPTIELRNAETRCLASAYDQVQHMRGDPRRAHTYYRRKS
jgi:hypothetical protein